MRRVNHLLAAVAMTVAGFLAGAAGVHADPLSVEQGKRLANTWCASCHVVGTDGNQTAVDGVVTFPDLARRPDFDEESMAFALFSPHPAMPNMVVTREEIRALYTYVRSLDPDREAEIRQGRTIVESRCSECHAVTTGAIGADPKAPRLTTLAQTWPVDALAEALA